MAAEQTEKAYQKQLGVNVGCVSHPRLLSRASPATTSPVFSEPIAGPRLTPSRLSPTPTASAPRARRRVPARTVPATTRTSVLASRPRVRLSRVSRRPVDRRAPALREISGFIRVRGCSPGFWGAVARLEGERGDELGRAARANRVAPRVWVVPGFPEWLGGRSRTGARGDGDHPKSSQPAPGLPATSDIFAQPPHSATPLLPKNGALTVRPTFLPDNRHLHRQEVPLHR